LPYLAQSDDADGVLSSVAGAVSSGTLVPDLYRHRIARAAQALQYEVADVGWPAGLQDSASGASASRAHIVSLAAAPMALFLVALWPPGHFGAQHIGMVSKVAPTVPMAGATPPGRWHVL
jgi:hypothetical protein